MTVVGFAGMTHLGINSAVATAARGFSVVGYDPDAGLIDRLRRRDFPLVEPGLDALAAANAARLDYASELQALAACDVVYIAADVPTDDTALSDLAPIRALVATVAGALDDKAILVVLCQVPPGFTRGIGLLPPSRLYYQVETLIFGRAMDRALNPERFIVGCAEPGKDLPVHYHAVLEAFGCPILPMRFESAELAKIAINFCLVASVSVANTLAEVTEAIGADWAEIVPALQLDQRIGPHSYLKPGLGIAGGNLERDLRTVLEIAKEKRTDAGVIEAWLGNSAHRKAWCWQRLQLRGLTERTDARIAVLGLAYKENTSSTKNSPSLALLAELRGRDVRVHDPVVPSTIVPFATGCPTPLACAEGADALVLATPWPEYRGLAVIQLAQVMRGRLIIDPYRLLDGGQAAAAGFEYHALGMPALMPG